MPPRFVGSRVFGASSEDVLVVDTELAPSLISIFYQPSDDKVKTAREHLAPAEPAVTRRKLLEVGSPGGFLSIYPLNTFATHPDFLKPKYKQIESITLEGFDFSLPGSEDDVVALLDELPAGFVKDFSYGLGLVKDYRFIIEILETVPQIKHLVVSRENETGIADDLFTLSFKEYDAIRRGLNRITTRQQNLASRDKRIFAHNELLTSLDAERFPEITRPYEKDTIFKLISSDGKVPLSDADQNAAVRLIDQNKRELAEKAPAQLLQLRNDIELVTLEVLISKYEAMLSKTLPEARWQALFNDNSFILNLAFGYPVIKVCDQAHVGGQRLSGAGSTIADFLVKNHLSNNTALFEIKTPDTPLLNATPYREQLYTPSSKLSGAMNQMLDQKNEFQKDIARIKDSSRIQNLESYAVHGVLIIGTMPQGIDQQKSFELFRGNSKDVAVITFDELLAKLKFLHEFLSSHAPEARRSTAFQVLEARAIRLQFQLQGLYERVEPEGGSPFMSAYKPLPGVDGNSVMAAIGKLGLVKHGFDRAKLRTPPYPVRFDDSGQHAINVDTLEEFIKEADSAIAEVETLLAAQREISE
jgi:hypothetical protein